MNALLIISRQRGTTRGLPSAAPGLVCSLPLSCIPRQLLKLGPLQCRARRAELLLNMVVPDCHAISQAHYPVWFSTEIAHTGVLLKHRKGSSCCGTHPAELALQLHYGAAIATDCAFLYSSYICTGADQLLEEIAPCELAFQLHYRAADLPTISCLMADQ